MNKQMGVYIPARLTSERLPNKLILPIGDTCLFEIACQKLNQLPSQINKYALIYDQKLIDIASKYNNIQIILRSQESTLIDKPLQSVFYDLNIIPDTHLMFLNPCLAFLKTETIYKALEQFRLSNYDYGTSVKMLQNWIFDQNGNSINDINYKELNTKTIEPLLQTAHCFHIFNKNNFFNDGQMLKQDFLPIQIPHEETIDVDTLEEYYYAKWKYENL